MPTSTTSKPEKPRLGAASPRLAIAGGLILFASAALLAFEAHNVRAILTWLGIALFFASAVVAMRAATLSAALCGMLVAFIAGLATGFSGFAALIVLFVLTWTSTRIGRERKFKLGTAESRKGRKASQIIANLGTFGILAAASRFCPHAWNVLLLAGAAAALAEAAGDTVSSELGQVYGGTPYLITRWVRVAPGTDGGITLPGTLAGSGACILVLLGWSLAARALPRWMFAAVLASIAGILFDSLLGAMIERRGWLNNDGVNFSSTWFAAFAAMALTRVFQLT